jgi:hypothetical protein
MGSMRQINDSEKTEAVDRKGQDRIYASARRSLYEERFYHRKITRFKKGFTKRTRLRPSNADLTLSIVPAKD